MSLTILNPEQSGEPVSETLADDVGWFDGPEEAIASQANRQSQTELFGVCFDIETVPDYSRLDSFGLDPLPEIRAEASTIDCPPCDQILTESLDAIRQRLAALNPVDEYLNALLAAEQQAKKPRVGIADAIASVRKAREAVKNGPRDRSKLLSVTPEYCRVAAIGWATGGGEVQSLTCGEHPDCDTADERLLLQTFWSVAMDARPLIGFNVLGFDLRVIFVRSAILGVLPSRLIDMKPWGRDVLDLMEVRFSRSQAMGLKRLAPLYGIAVPAGDCEGSQVEELMKTDPKKVGEYCRSDVTITRELYRKFAGYFCP